LSLTLGGGVRAVSPAPPNRVKKNSQRRHQTGKLSPELVQKARESGTSGESVTVVLQFNSEPSGGLRALLSRNGVRVKAERKSLASSTVELPAEVVEELASFPEVEYVSVDRDLQVLGHLEVTTGAQAMRAQSGNSGFKGKDINIAVLDSGIYKDHHSFAGVEAQVDFTGENRTDDPFGHGTHVASMAAGRDHVGSGAFTSVAPEAKIINLRVLNSRGVGKVSNVLNALNWILTPVDPNFPNGEKNHQKYRIRVVNMSLGTAAVDSYQDDPLCRAARRLVDAGIVVVAAAGNDGKDAFGNKLYGSIHSPGNEPSVITVGAANTFGTNNRGGDVITTYSSRGPTRSGWTDANGVKHYDNVIKPELVAPGNKLIGAEARANVVAVENPELSTVRRNYAASSRSSGAGANLVSILALVYVQCTGFGF